MEVMDGIPKPMEELIELLMEVLIFLPNQRLYIIIGILLLLVPIVQ